MRYTVDTRTPEEIEAAQRKADVDAETIRLGTEYRDEMTDALELPEGPERQQAIKTVVRKYEALSGPSGALKLLEIAEQEVDRKHRAADQLAAQPGFQYDWETMQPKTDPITGAPVKTVAQLERERAAEAQRASAELAERAQGERERAADVTAQQTQQANLIAQQRADEEGRSAIEKELTARTGQRTTALTAGATAAGIGTGREVGTSATMAAGLGAQSAGLDRDGITALARQMGIGAATLDAVLSGFDSFQSQQQQLRAQQQPVRRAPDLGALPPQARGGVAALGRLPSTPGAPTAAAPPAALGVPPAQPPMFGAIGPNAYNWMPQAPGGPVAAAAALAPPPPMGEPETVMLPRTAAVPSTLEELLNQLDLMPAYGAR